MSKKSTAFLVGAIVTVISTFVVNNIVVNGAKLGGEGIAKSTTYSARLNPNGYYWEALPYSLFGGLCVGLLAATITYFVTSNRSKQ